MERLHRDSKVSEAPRVEAVVQRREDPGAAAAGPAAAPRGDAADAAAGEHAEGGQSAWEADDSFLSAAGLDTSNKEGGKGDAEVPPWVKQGSMDPDSKAPRGDGKATEAAPVPPAKEGADAAKQGGDAAKPGGDDAAAEPDKDAAAKPEAAPSDDAGESPADDEVGVATVQRKESGDSTGDVHAAASSGIGGPSTTLPHLDAIQASFGHHDVSGVAAHTDGQAAAANQAMGAEAFATGNHVAFDSGAPSLHTAAHEAAHVVQQQGGGVQLKGGVGEAGDSWEQHADAVADQVVQGNSAVDLLDRVAAGGPGTSGAGGEPLQMKPKPFEPKIKTPSPLKVKLNDSIKGSFKVTNAAKAPKGTTYGWQLKSGSQSDAFGPVTLGGADTTEVSLAATTKLPTQGGAHFVAEVTVTRPGGIATKHEVSWDVEVERPSVTVTKKVKPGKYSKNNPDALRPGDTLQVLLNVNGLKDPRGTLSAEKNLLSWTLNLVNKLDDEDDPFQPRPLKWIDQDTAMIEVYAHHAGTGLLNLVSILPETFPVSEVMQLNCTSGWDFFIERCGAATDRHIRLIGVADQYLKGCLDSYIDAHKNFQGVIDNYLARKQLTKDIFLGILFAGIGGAAGGFAGYVVEAQFKEAQKSAAGAIVSFLVNSKAVEKTVTDGAKDLVKFSARLPGQLMGSSGSTSETPATTGGGTKSSGGGGGKVKDPTPGASGVAQGKDAVAGVDPLTWYAQAGQAVDEEKQRIAKIIEDWKEGASNAKAQGIEHDVDFDPINAVTDSMKLGGVHVTALGAPPDPILYEKNMWEVWVTTYGHSVKFIDELEDSDGNLNQDRFEVSDDIPGEHKKRLTAVSKKLDALGVDKGWLDALTDRARAPHAAEANKKTKELWDKRWADYEKGQEGDDGRD